MSRAHRIPTSSTLSIYSNLVLYCITLCKNMFCIYYVYISIFVCMKFSVCTELNQYMSVDLELGGVVNLFCSPQRFAQKGSLFISNLGISP